ncbi:hypothetical protein GCM10027155_08780 [Acinetobacter apis]|uniref:Uncharacterized protein n=1 Tax=Acinetobacter apis TaxID=1229165 RepID=A0A217EFJ5_9GAMM|nr:hypothetical protein [Acinetobacter apis]SNQ28956.1 hypothetical protein SAMN05444584_0887 [Acinetobacter apis]
MNKTSNRPEIITIEDQLFGSHVEHWSLLTDTPTETVPAWLGQALEHPEMPMGLCATEADMDEDAWLIQGPSQSLIQVAQVIEVENQQPRAVKIAFPVFNSPYKMPCQVERIICSDRHSQAVLRLSVGKQQAIVYAFDNLYSVNHNQYIADQRYAVSLSAWAYELDVVDPKESIVVDDPASIKHHRALNDILAQHQGVAPHNLQELIDQWQPQSEDDKAPLNVDFSKMVAYLHGEHLGQEDEAWFQGKIVGKTSTQFMQDTYTLFDVILLLSDQDESTLIRVATKNPAHNKFEINQYIRGNIWIQANIYSTAA